MTAPQGKCAGCPAPEGVGPVRVIERHIAECRSWARLYQQGLHPLGPADEYARYLAEDRDAEHAADLQARVDDTVRRRLGSVARFEEPDLLGE